jgi:hypothetical protein
MVILNGIFNGRSSCHMAFPVFYHQIKGVSVKCPINQGILGRFIPPTLLEQKRVPSTHGHYTTCKRCIEMRPFSLSRRLACFSLVSKISIHRSNCLSNLVYNLSTSSN